MTVLVLAGAGHAHAQVLLDFARRPLPDLQIVLISPHALAPYSGMVPGWLAGHYAWQECCLDFDALCAKAGARLVRQQVLAADLALRALLLDNGERIDFDWLSINIGATLRPPSSEDTTVLAMRPLVDLHAGWERLLANTRALPAGERHRLVMVGGGAAGVESVLAAHQRLTTQAPQVDFAFSLATSADQIVPGMAKRAAQLLRRQLEARKITLVTGFSAGEIFDHMLRGEDGRQLPADTVLWATGAEAHRWPQTAGLACNTRGFISIDRQLRSLSHARVFAAGDCAGWQDDLPKAGVFAVRMGPVLAHNLRAAILGQRLQDYLPQKRYLVLIGTGGAHAVGAWGPLAWQGKWVWRWKQSIDRRFLHKYL